MNSNALWRDSTHNTFPLSLDPWQPDTHACHQGRLRSAGVQPAHVRRRVVGPGTPVGVPPHPGGQLHRPEGTELHALTPQRLPRLRRQPGPRQPDGGEPSDWL